MKSQQLVLTKKQSSNEPEDRIDKSLLFCIFDKTSKLFEDKINLINHENIKIIDENSFNSSLLFSESFAEMYYNFIVIRRILNNNISFTRQVISILAKIVHPNIQLFYGIMIEKEFSEEFNKLSPCLLDDDSNLVTLKRTLFNIPILLEYVDGVELKRFSSLNSLLSSIDSLYIKLIIFKKISETVTFLHKSGYPHLILNGKNIKINYNLIKDASRLIFSGNSYAEANFLKITEIGSFYKYSSSMQFTLETEMFYEQSFHSPFLFLLFENNHDFSSDLIGLLKNDLWSFGCIIYELLTGLPPFETMGQGENLKNFLLKSFFINGNENTKQIDKDLFMKFHENYLDDLKNEFFILFPKSNEEKIMNFYNKILYLLKICTYGSKSNKYSGNTSKETKFEDLNEVILSIINDFTDLQKENQVQITGNNEENEDKLKKYKPYIDYSINKYIDIVELDELISRNEKTYEELKEKTIEYDSMEHKLKVQLKQQENSSLINKFQLTTSRNIVSKSLFFVLNDVKNHIFAFDSSENSSFFLDVFNFKDSKTNNLKGIKKLKTNSNIDEVNFVIDSSLILYDTCIYYSFKNQRLYVSGGKVYFSIDENKNVTISDLNQQVLSKQKTQNSRRSKKINVIFLNKYSHNMNLQRTKELSLQSKSLSNLSKSDKSFYSGEIGNMLIKRSRHKMIEINDYVIIVGGEQDTKCEILDVKSGNIYYIEDLNTIHINPILYVIGNILYSFNFEGLMLKLKDLFYLEKIDDSSTGVHSSNNRKTNINLREVTGNIPSLSLMTRNKSMRSLDNLNISSTTSMHNIQSSKNWSSKKNSEDSSKGRKATYDDIENNENIDENKFDEIIILESLLISDLNSITKWSKCNVNADALLAIEPVQFTFYNSFQLLDYIYIFGMENLNEIDTNFLYLIKFHIKDMKFESSKPVHPSNKFNIFKYALKMSSNIISDESNFYFYNFKLEKVEKVAFKDVTL